MSSNEISVEKPSKPQRLGTISLILGIVTGLGNCLLLVLTAVLFVGAGEFGFLLLLAFVIGIQSILGLLCLSGFILGIMALVRRESGKGKAITGMILNTIFICLTTSILWFSVPLLSSLAK